MRVNIEGQKFGRLLVEKFVGQSKDRKALWKCRCDCGNITTVRGKHLRQGKIVSCGCYRRQRVTETFFKDLTGKRFGRLMAKKVSRNDNGCYVWSCQCDCGKIAEVPGNKLTFGHTKSCGCLLSDVCSKRMKNICKKQKGKNHPRWNPNLTDEERRERIERKREEFRESKWRDKVYERDKYICQKCGDNRGGNLNAHHIYSWKEHRKLRYVVSNGITFCQDCHKKFHKINGYGNNTRKQLSLYM